METSFEKENMLKLIREGLIKAEFKNFDKKELSNSEIFVSPGQPLIEIFKDELEKINGEFFYCHDKEELIFKLNEINISKNLGLCYSPDPEFMEIIGKSNISYTKKFEDTKAIKSAISSCEFLIARYGSVMVSSALPGGRRVFSFPEIHIVIASEKQLLMEIEEGFAGIQQKYGDELPSQIINISGPSRTADIEKTLILGAHGPKQLIVFVLKSL